MHFASKKRLIIGVLILLAAVLFVFWPRKASALYLRVTFEEFTGDACSLYYTTDSDGNFSQEKCISSEVDPDTMQATFRLDGSLAGHLTGLRLDFPHTEQLLGIKDVTVSSAGVIQKEFNPCHFFAPENIGLSHNADVTLVVPRNRVYISAGADDPFLILSDGLTAQITDCYSHQTGFRLLVCLFVAGCVCFAHRKIFADPEASSADKITVA